MYIFYVASSSYHWSYIFLLHLSPGEFDVYSLPVNESQNREMGQFGLKSADTDTDINTDRVVK